jgi:glyoxylase-like metal-dependent hydrolase (beta-lactamase superfamily II)
LIHLLEVPAPFAVGPVNAYLIEGSPLTLVDSGPNTATALVAIERLLAGHGYRVEELERIVVTHHHLDHTGLIDVLAERSSAEVVGPRAAAQYMADPHAAWRDDRAFMRRLLLAHGVDEQVVDVQTSQPIPLLLGAPVHVTAPVDDGDVLQGSETSLDVHDRPGHSASDIVLHDPVSRTLITGDHLLAEISSNALVARPLDAPPDAPRPKPLLRYRESLRATRELDVEVALGGHGPPIVEVRELIDSRLAQQESRAAKLLGLLRPRPHTAHELAQTLFRQKAFTQLFLTISEVLGHLDLLLAQGAIAENATGSVVVFEAV